MAQVMDHSTDRLIWAHGFSEREVFANALSELNEVMLPGFCQSVAHYDCLMHVHLSAEDASELLEAFLARVVALTKSQKALFCHVGFDAFGKTGLSANLFGRWYGQLENDVRIITSRGLDVASYRTEMREVAILLGVHEAEHA